LILILAAVGIVKALKRRSLAGEANIHVVRFLAFYSVLLIVFYSAIPYKTPWCMLGFLHGAILMAGVAAVAIWQWLPRRWLRRTAAALFVIGVFHLGLQAYRGSFVLYADARNPYVYGHTSTDFLRLAERMEDLAKIHPEGYRMPIRLIISESDYWPLPWYLRRFENVIPSDKVPEDPDAAVIITTPDLQEDLDAKLYGRYFKEVFGLRPGVLLVAYIQQPLWDAFIRTRE
jgi:predicted membrane-bound mannosyltransferase